MSTVYASENPKVYVPAPFSRAPYFIITDPYTGKRTITNPYKDALGGAAPLVVPYLIYEYEMTEVHAKSYGPNAIQMLRSKHIRAYSASRTRW